MLTKIEKLFIYSIAILSFLTNHSIKCWDVTCDKLGQCNIILANSNKTMTITPFHLPLIPEKNVVPLKNNSNSIMNEIVTSIKSISEGKPRYGYVPNSQFECADGVGECINGCCRNGFCSDPENLCTMNVSEIKVIILIVGLVFVVLIIGFWITFYLLGVVNNKKPLLSKEEEIYVRFTPKIRTVEDMSENNIGGSGNDNVSKNIYGDDHLPPVYAIEKFEEIHNEGWNYNNVRERETIGKSNFSNKEVMDSPTSENLISNKMKNNVQAFEIETEQPTPDFRTKPSKGKSLDRRKNQNKKEKTSSIAKGFQQNQNEIEQNSHDDIHHVNQDVFEEKKLND